MNKRYKIAMFILRCLEWLLNGFLLVMGMAIAVGVVQMVLR